MLLIQVCEPCCENGFLKVGVYRDDVAQVLCDDCVEARELARQKISGDYWRQVETEPRIYKRPQGGRWKDVA